MKVSRFPTTGSSEPELDLQTVRETLLYMHHDLDRVRGMERVARALKSAIDEISAAQDHTSGQPAPANDKHNETLVPFAARFVPRSAHR